MKTYTLQMNQKGRDKWLYTIIDSDGNICATRMSKREYVAATIDGQFFFGRRDLVGCGDHGKAILNAKKAIAATTKEYDQEISSSRRWASRNGYDPEKYVARLKEMMGTPEQWVKERQEYGKALMEKMQVAYLPAIS